MPADTPQGRTGSPNPLKFPVPVGSHLRPRYGRVCSGSNRTPHLVALEAGIPTLGHLHSNDSIGLFTHKTRVTPHTWGLGAEAGNCEGPAEGLQRAATTYQIALVATTPSPGRFPGLRAMGASTPLRLWGARPGQLRNQ